ncbi:hypothetical protein AMK32_38330 [Streptomyces sp. CB01883]|nr:hypothetical protein AMK32_38330 [Streptomyces sp. CB01883]
MGVDDELVAPLETGSPQYVDPARGGQFVDDAACRVDADGLAGARAGVMAQVAGEDALGQGDPLHDGMGDDRVGAQQPGAQVLARGHGQPDEPLGGLQGADPAACGGAAAARQGTACVRGEFDDTVGCPRTQLCQAPLHGGHGKAQVGGEGGDPRGAALLAQAERLDLDVDAECRVGVVG